MDKAGLNLNQNETTQNLVKNKLISKPNQTTSAVVLIIEKDTYYSITFG